MKKKLLKEIKEQGIMCSRPFQCVNIDTEGNVDCCCHNYRNLWLGNIFEESFNDIWNGKRFTKLRENILTDKYRNCNLDMCYNFEVTSFFDKNSININCESPKYITLSIDSGCNVKCVFCRDDVLFINKEETARLKKLIDTDYFIPLLKNTEVITLNGAGELFVSKFCKLFIEKVVKKYPKIRFEILTNGLLCNEKTLKEF